MVFFVVVVLLCNEWLRLCLVIVFKQQKLLFKYHNTYFHTFLPACIFIKFKQGEKSLLVPTFLGDFYFSP